MTAQLCPAPVFTQNTGTGAPMAGGQLFSYAAGTTTPQATYVDSTQTTQNTNPVILNSLGQANVWLNPVLSYKLVMQDAAGNQVWSVDNILGTLAPNVVIGPPVVGSALTVIGSAGVTNFAQTISSPNVAGQSNGLLISAGTNASDAPLVIGAAGGAPLFAVLGNGNVLVANVKQPVFTTPLAGFGTPTGNVVVGNFLGGSATLLQCSQTIAQILLTLKAAGIYAA